jgi:hypothetical protein
MFGFMKNNDKMHAFAKSRTLWQKANLARAALADVNLGNQERVRKLTAGYHGTHPATAGLSFGAPSALVALLGHPCHSHSSTCCFSVCPPSSFVGR